MQEWAKILRATGPTELDPKLASELDKFLREFDLDINLSDLSGLGFLYELWKKEKGKQEAKEKYARNLLKKAEGLIVSISGFKASKFASKPEAPSAKPQFRAIQGGLSINENERRLFGRLGIIEESKMVEVLHVITAQQLSDRVELAEGMLPAAVARKIFASNPMALTKNDDQFLETLETLQNKHIIIEAARETGQSIQGYEQDPKALWLDYQELQQLLKIDTPKPEGHHAGEKPQTIQKMGRDIGEMKGEDILKVLVKLGCNIRDAKGSSHVIVRNPRHRPEGGESKMANIVRRDRYSSFVIRKLLPKIGITQQEFIEAMD